MVKSLLKSLIYIRYTQCMARRLALTEVDGLDFWLDKVESESPCLTSVDLPLHEASHRVIHGVWYLNDSQYPP